MKPADRVEALKRDLIEPHQTIFDAALKPSMGQLKDASIAKYIDIVDAKIPLIRTISAEFPSALTESCEVFGKTFPDMNWRWNAYLMPSLYTFDGMSSEIDSQSVMLFGADALADEYKSLSGTDFKTFLTHEVFHIYHHQILPDEFDEYMGSMRVYKPLYLCLWTEGLACYVSQVINPKASLAEVVLSKELAETAPKSATGIAKEFGTAFASTTSNDHARFFSAGYKGALPARSGYYLGLIVVQHLSEKHPLKELVRLSGRELEEEIRNALREISTSGDAIKTL